MTMFTDDICGVLPSNKSKTSMYTLQTLQTVLETTEQ